MKIRTVASEKGRERESRIDSTSRDTERGRKKKKHSDFKYE